MHNSYYMFSLVSEIEHDVMRLVSMTSYQCPVPIATTSGELILYRDFGRNRVEETRDQSDTTRTVLVTSLIIIFVVICVVGVVHPSPAKRGVQ